MGGYLGDFSGSGVAVALRKATTTVLEAFPHARIEFSRGFAALAGFRHQVRAWLRRSRSCTYHRPLSRTLPLVEAAMAFLMDFMYFSLAQPTINAQSSRPHQTRTQTHNAFPCSTPSSAPWESPFSPTMVVGELGPVLPSKKGWIGVRCTYNVPTRYYARMSLRSLGDRSSPIQTDEHLTLEATANHQVSLSVSADHQSEWPVHGRRSGQR